MQIKLNQVPNMAKSALWPLLPWIPAAFLVSLLFSPTDIYIAYMHLQLSAGWFVILTQLFMISWITTHPFGRIRGSFFSEFALSILPAELVELVVFAQYHPALSVSLLGICLAAPVAIHIMVRTVAGRQNAQKRRRRCRILVIRAALITAALVLLLPGAAGIYYTAADVPLIKPAVAAQSEDLFGVQQLEAPKPVIAFLNEERWSHLGRSEKLDVLQQVLNNETAYLCIPAVPLSSDKLPDDISGAFRIKGRYIQIDYEYLASAKAENCIKTICHEARHAYQHDVVDSLDWENDNVRHGFYYRQAREWKADHDTPLPDNSYSAYYNQSIEIDARTYASERVEEYVKQIP